MLLQRCETLVTEEGDKQKEREKEVLTRCGHPQWTISTVQRKTKKKEDNIMKKTVEKDKGKGMVVLP